MTNIRNWIIAGGVGIPMFGIAAGLSFDFGLVHTGWACLALAFVSGMGCAVIATEF